MHVRDLIPMQRGHFIFESGHHGTLWLDLDALFQHPASLRTAVSQLGQRLLRHRIETICGPMSGGAFLACMIATSFDLRFVPIERHRVQPVNDAPSVTYRLPSTNLTGQNLGRVAIVDDVINAGSAIRGSITALEAIGADIVAIGALLLLGEAFRTIPFPVERLQSERSPLWMPEECPLCAEGQNIDMQALR